MLTPFPKDLPTKLALATDKVAWVRAALLAGFTVSDTGMWVAGVDNPQGLVRKLRKEGMAVLTTRKRLQDCEGVWYNDLAWRLA